MLLTHLTSVHDSDRLIEIMSDQISTHGDDSLSSIFLETPLSAWVSAQGNDMLRYEVTIRSKRLFRPSEASLCVCHRYVCWIAIMKDAEGNRG